MKYLKTTTGELVLPVPEHLTVTKHLDDEIEFEGTPPDAYRSPSIKMVDRFVRMKIKLRDGALPSTAFVYQRGIWIDEDATQGMKHYWHNKKYAHGGHRDLNRVLRWLIAGGTGLL